MTNSTDKDGIIEVCAKVVDGLLEADEATAQQDSVMAGYATAGYRQALKEAANAIRALKSRS